MEMTNILIVVTVAMISFIATNFENLLLLIVFLSNSIQPISTVALGYLMSTVMIVGLARIISEVAEFIPSKFLGLLGLIPLTLGIWELLQILRHKISTSVPNSSVGLQPRSFVNISVIMIANGGDSLAVFAAFFADTQWYLKWLIWVSALAMTLILFSLAAWLVRLKFFSASRQRIMQIIMPFLLIGIGIYILVNSPTDIVP